eukprot:PhM_4_TR11263/c0_g1_i1/m.12221
MSTDFNSFEDQLLASKRDELLELKKIQTTIEASIAAQKMREIELQTEFKHKREELSLRHHQIMSRSPSRSQDMEDAQTPMMIGKGNSNSNNNNSSSAWPQDDDDADDNSAGRISLLVKPTFDRSTQVSKDQIEDEVKRAAAQARDRRGTVVPSSVLASPSPVLSSSIGSPENSLSHTRTPIISAIPPLPPSAMLASTMTVTDTGVSTSRSTARRESSATFLGNSGYYKFASTPSFLLSARGSARAQFTDLGDTLSPSPSSSLVPMVVSGRRGSITARLGGTLTLSESARSERHSSARVLEELGSAAWSGLPSVPADPHASGVLRSSPVHPRMMYLDSKRSFEGNVLRQTESVGSPGIMQSGRRFSAYVPEAPPQRSTSSGRLRGPGGKQLRSSVLYTQYLPETCRLFQLDWAMTDTMLCKLRSYTDKAMIPICAMETPAANPANRPTQPRFVRLYCSLVFDMLHAARRLTGRLSVPFDRPDIMSVLLSENGEAAPHEHGRAVAEALLAVIFEFEALLAAPSATGTTITSEDDDKGEEEEKDVLDESRASSRATTSADEDRAALLRSFRRGWSLPMSLSREGNKKTKRAPGDVSAEEQLMLCFMSYIRNCDVLNELSEIKTVQRWLIVANEEGDSDAGY